MNVLIATASESDWQGLPEDVSADFCGVDVDSINAALNETVEALVTDAMPTKVDACCGLRWIQLLSSGAEQLTNHPLLRRPVLFSSAAGVCAVHIAEFVVAQTLRHYKELDQIRDLQESRRWGDRAALARPCLRGLHAVIVGYGGVGREAARLLSAFGVKMTAVAGPGGLPPRYHGYTPYEFTGDPEGATPEKIVPAGGLSDVLPAADVVVLCVALNSSTRDLINAENLGRMKESSILINVSRGAVVDSRALLAALDQGRPARAFLDVFEQEPLPANSPLWAHPKIFVSPHMAGVMPDHGLKLKKLFLENLRNYRAGTHLINQLDPDRFIDPHSARYENR